MRKAIYKYLTSASKRLGFWLFRIVAWWISSGYFFFTPKRTSISVRFYKELFPAKNLFYYLRCVWKQYHNFTNVFLDRFILEDSGHLNYTSEGWEHIEEAVNKKTGGILLMSHMGNWEVAAHLLKKRGMRMLLYMGIKEKEQIEHAQKQSLEKSGLKIIAVTREKVSPFDLIEGVNFLKDGGLVSLTGDRIWQNDQKTVTVKLLGHEAVIPETPYTFAMLSGSPLFFFFAFRTSKQQYHFQISPPLYMKNVPRAKRKEVIQNTAQSYADAIEENLRKYPFEWFHFEEFLKHS
jgi:predicted LPLAT superfamily acyltransferase